MRSRPGRGAPAEVRGHTALRIALVYALAASLWIWGSDWLLGRLIRDPAWLVQAAALKGWLFVAVTAALLYALVRRSQQRAAGEAPATGAAQAAAPAPSALPFLLLSGGIVALTVLALLYGAGERRARHVQQIEALSALHAGQVATWFSYRHAQAQFVRSSAFYAELYRRWRDGGDAEARAQLIERLAGMRRAFGNHAVLLFDAHGALVASEGDAQPPLQPGLPELVRGVVASGEVRHLQGHGPDEALWLDSVVPLQGDDGRVQAAVALRVDPQDFLLPILRGWPAASRTGATVLLRREGEDVVSLLGRRAVPLSAPGLLAGRALLGQLPYGRVAEGVDHRGVPVIGVVRPVPGTDWLLSSRMDLEELQAESLKSAFWILAAGAMALLGAAVGRAMLRERRALQAAHAQRVAQEERLRGLALVQAVTDSVLDHMAVLDREGAIVKVNAAWSRFAADAGRPGGADAPAHWARGEEAAAAAAGIEAVLAGRRDCFSLAYPCELPQRRCWFRMTVTPLRTEAGGAVVVHADITERHAAQEQLRKLSLAVEQNPVGIAIRDTAGRIEYVNDAFTRISGFSREEALGHPIERLQPGRTPPGQDAALLQALQRGQAWAGEFGSTRRNGERYFELVRAAPIRQPDGQVTHHLLLCEDVTEKKRTAAELERHRHHLQELVAERTQQLQQANAELVLARDRADAANQAKSAFLANMSHEIRTPLNAVIGLTHLLRRDALDALQAERLHKVGAAAHHLLQVINDILDLSKIEAGRMELEDTGFSLRALLDDAVALVADRAQAKGLALAVCAAPEVPDALRGDPTRLSQALLNLLSNAVKFTAQGGITVHAGVLQRDAQGLLLRLGVRDTGIGIAPGQLEPLFEPFVQSDPSTTRRFGGSGLGLAITRRLAAIMGGETGAHSAPGAGSEFWFSARLREGGPALPAPAPAALDAAGLRARAGAQVLLVEDDPVDREVTAELLRAAGLQVDTAADGLQALEAARQRRHDLILMDLQLPQLDGLEAARRIRALPAHARTPVVALTAQAFAEDRARCLAAGMDDHVAKPVQPPRLYAVLQRWLPVRAGAALSPDVAAAAAAEPAAAAAAHGGDAAVEAAQLEALAQLLGAGDYRAVACWRALAPALLHEDGGAAAAVGARLGTFDFEGALAALQALRRAREPA